VGLAPPTSHREGREPEGHQAREEGAARAPQQPPPDEGPAAEKVLPRVHGVVDVLGDGPRGLAQRLHAQEAEQDGAIRSARGQRPAQLPQGRGRQLAPSHAATSRQRKAAEKAW
jgi:hypothetical protein